jgi:hypothetical protein
MAKFLEAQVSRLHISYSVIPACRESLWIMCYTEQKSRAKKDSLLGESPEATGHAGMTARIRLTSFYIVTT